MANIPSFILKRKVVYAKAFEDAGYQKIADHLRECSEVELLLACENCGDLRYVVYHCDTRVCPICSWYQSIARSKFIRRLIGKMEFPKMLTLTTPQVHVDPREQIKYLRKCFQRLRDRKVFENVKGGAYQIEVKVKEGRFHVHMHIILDCPFIHYTQIYKAWADITGTDGVQVDIRAAKTKAQIDYVVKYAQKSAELRADGSDVVRWYEAVKGSRLFGTFGEWFNVKEEDLLEEGEELPEPMPCQNCGEVGHQFFVRDGPMIFGKDWKFKKTFYDRKGFPESRKIAIAKPPKEEQIFMALLDELAESCNKVD